MVVPSKTLVEVTIYFLTQQFSSSDLGQFSGACKGMEPADMERKELGTGAATRVTASVQDQPLCAQGSAVDAVLLNPIIMSPF